MSQFVILFNVFRILNSGLFSLLKSLFQKIRFFKVSKILLLSSLLFPLIAPAEDLDELESFQKIVAEAQALPPTYLSEEDPYEPFNRAVFKFNMWFNDYLGQPVAQAYLDYTPQPIQTGFKNFFDNLGTPISATNHLLQGKFQTGLESLMRFAINSVFGLGGVIDIASPAGLNPEKEDFGQTLAVWHVWPEAHYLVVPFIGSTTTRNFMGDIVDGSVDPVYTAEMVQVDSQQHLALTVGDKFIDYTQVVPFLNDLKKQPDPYVFAREAYLQHRKNVLYDGHPPVPSLEDFDFE